MDFPKNLIVSTIPQKYIIADRSKSVDEHRMFGIDGRLLSIISEVLNFQYTLKFPPESDYGRKDDNGNWSGIVGMMHRGEADLGIGQIAVTPERTEVVDFSVPYTNQEITFLIKKAGLLPVSWNIFHPFQIQVWLLLMCALIITPAIYRLLIGGKVSYNRTLIHFYSSLFGKSFPVKDNCLKVRSLVACWVFFAIIVTNSYTAGLLSFLTLPLHQKTVRNFKELSNAVRQGTHTCLVVGDVLRLRNVDEENIRYLGDMIIKNRWFLDRTKQQSKDLVSETTAIIDLRFVLEMLKAELNSGSYIISEDVLFSWSVAMIFRKDFCCKIKINKLIERLLNSGMYEKLLRDARQTMIISTEKINSHHKVNPVCIHDIMAPCLLLIVGYILSIIILVVEIIFARVYGKSQKVFKNQSLPKNLNI